MRNIIVAIDGPTGSGKSSVAKKIAEKYSLTYLDTGSMYRMITLFMLENSIDIFDEEKVVENLKNIDISFKNNIFYLNDRDVSYEIRTQKVNDAVSQVSSFKKVREKMVDMQRKIASKQSSILDGRDIGSAVFPNADVKIFLTADARVRAERRYKEQLEKGIDKNVGFEDVLKSLEERDFKDINKREGALIKTADAILIDTTNLTFQEVLNKIGNIIEEKIKN